MTPLRDARFAFTADTGTVDAAAGTRSGGYTESFRRWCAYLPIGDGTFAALRALFAGAQFGLVVLYDSDVLALTPAHRAVWIGRSLEYDILGVTDPDGRRFELHIALAQRGVPRAVSP